MAIIEVQGELRGEASTEALAGKRISASAACHGMAAAGKDKLPREPEPEPETTKKAQ